MLTDKYPERLPQLRVSREIFEAINARAGAQNISLAEAHRQTLAAGLWPTMTEIPVIRVLGAIDPASGVITWREEVA